MYFLVKGIRASVWGTNDINIGGTGLTNINFGVIGNQVKFIITMKYFLTSLGQLMSAMDVVEKTKVEKLTFQLLNQHEYFTKTWRLLSESEKKQVLDITVCGKGVIPYEKVFFSKDEFYSSLKGKAVNDKEYNNAKKLYTLLRMRDLSDLDDLYNLQDAILLLEIMENRFQVMY